MPLDEIRKSIESTASREAERIRKEADEEKDRTIREAKKRAEAVISEATERAEEEAKALEMSFKANLDFDIGAMETNARNEAIGRELLAVRKEIARELDAHAGEILKGAVKEFSKIVGTGGMTAVAGKKYAGAAKEAGLKAELNDEMDGFILRNGDGTITLDATKGSMMDRIEPQMRELIAKGLEGKAHAAAKAAGARPKRATAEKAKKAKAAKHAKAAETVKAKKGKR